MNRDITYLLDRNVVIDIRNFLDHHNARQIAGPKKIDVKSNFVSPMLSSIEGRFMRVQAAQDMREAILDESKLLARFFQKARTDAEFFTEEAESFADSFAVENSRKHNEITDLTRELKTILRRTYSLPDCFKVVEDILMLARRASVTVSHPLVVAAISTLFGNEAAHGVIKPRKGSNSDEEEKLLHNAVADFRLLSYFNIIRSFHNGGKRVRLLTRDAALNRFVNSIKLVGVSENFVPRDQEFRSTSTLTLSRELLPKIKTDRQWDRFCNSYHLHYLQQDKAPPFARSGLHLTFGTTLK